MTGNILKARVLSILNRFGHEVEFIRHSTSAGSTTETTWSERCLYIPLTPTFAHDVRMMPAGVNALENDQSDLILSGDTEVIEGDTLNIEGIYYRVTTVAPSIVNGIKVCNHALILRTGVDSWQ